MNTALNMIRMVKLLGWESKMVSLLEEKRDEELKYVRKLRFIELANMNVRCVGNFVDVPSQGSSS